MLHLELAHGAELLQLIVTRIERELEALVATARTHLGVRRLPRDVCEESEDSAVFALANCQRGAAAITGVVEILSAEFLLRATED